MSENIRVVTRAGTHQPLDISIVRKRIQALCFGLNLQFVNLSLVVQKVGLGVHDLITTAELDNLAAETCAYMNIVHPHYSILAARISVDNLRKNTKNSLKDVADLLFNCKDKFGRNAPLLSKDVYEFIVCNKEALDKAIDFSRDFSFDFFGFKTLQRSYLLKVDNKIVQRPQHMLMRVSVGIHYPDIEAVLQTYDLMSRKYFVHATPTLFNSGTPQPQMSSCFLLSLFEDSIDGIYQTLLKSAQISKCAGGLGIAISNVRAHGSYIRGTNGISNGIVPMLRVFNDTARYVDQGGGKRKGSFAIYLQPWHADIFQFLDLRKNTGKEENRARDLFYGLWVPDLFMRRVRDDGKWTLMCPNQCPGLNEVCGEEFDALYTRYEEGKIIRKVIQARELWQAIIDSQVETGTPYMMFKDACNKKSNQQHLGVIKCSNLCTQIVQYTSKEQIAVCNLASLSLPAFLDGKGAFDLQKLAFMTKVLTRNLNKIIDRNYYPVPQAKNSNFKHRPIGIGVQGLADVYQQLSLPYESEKASELNERIFETIYYAAITQSIEIAKKQGPYSTFIGSPTSKGLLQFDLWSYKPHLCGYDWDKVKQDIVKFGVRNSLLVAPMPTASTSQILGNNESFEPYTTNVYTRRVLAGQFVCINKNLVEYLIKHNIWTPQIRNKLIAQNGSISNIQEIPKDGKEIFKTVWEISQKEIFNLALGRSPFIDQSQSLNIHISQVSYAKMSSVHFYSWSRGLKTGMYYLRSRPAVDPIKFTLNVERLLKQAGQIIQQTLPKEVQEDQSLNKYKDKINEQIERPKLCPLRKNSDNECLACGS